jgi:hypothetical protein
MGLERSRHGRSSHIQSLPPISLFMKLLNLLIPALIAIVTAAAPVDAREKRSGEQDDVYKGTQGGAVKSLRSDRKQRRARPEIAGRRLYRAGI